jgi:hypothetical protein
MADEQGSQQEQPLNPDLMGYPNVESLVAAKRASDQEAMKIKAERDALQSIVQQQQTWQPEANPRQDVKRRERPEDRLTEFGVPVDAIQEMMRTEIQSAFAPIQAGINARTTLQAKHPDYGKFESDVAQYIASDPELSQRYNRMFAADPVGAFEYAFLAFGDSRRRSGTNGNGNGSPSQQDVVDASIPSSRGGETRRMPDSVTGDIQRAWQQYQKTGSTGDARAYAKARLKTVIKDEFLNT